jgi:hypothetical protein
MQQILNQRLVSDTYLLDVPNEYKVNLKKKLIYLGFTTNWNFI